MEVFKLGLLLLYAAKQCIKTTEFFVNIWAKCDDQTKNDEKVIR